MPHHEKTGTKFSSIARGRRPRGPSRFTQADLRRVIKAAQAAKLPVAAIRIEPDGSILIIPASPAPVARPETNPWDA